MLSLWRFKFAVLACSLALFGSVLPSSALAHETGLLCAQLFISTPLRSDLPPSVLFDGLAILDFLQEGGEAEAYKVRYKGKIGVFRYLHSRNPEQTYYTPLDQARTHQLQAMTEAEARRVFPLLQQRQDSYDKPLSEFEEAQLDQARTLLLSIDSMKLRHLRYHGQNLVPQTLALVRHSNGLIAGQIIEFVPGTTLRELFDRRILKASQIDSVIDQLKEQVQLLASEGFSHGDLVPSNIVVDLKNGRAQARLIDFNLQQKPGAELKKQMQIDLDGLERLRAFYKPKAHAIYARPSSRFASQVRVRSVRHCS
jgi:tRNA A-37 threonylcarbamoyl transferase component Bud32